MNKILITALLTGMAAGAYAASVNVTGIRDWGNNSSTNVNKFD